MSSSLIAGVRSVDFNIPDLEIAERFYTRNWQLEIVERSNSALYLAGSGSDPYLFGFHKTMGSASIRHVTLKARTLDALATMASNVLKFEGASASPIRAVSSPGGGVGMTIVDPMGRSFQIVFGDSIDRTPTPAMEGPVRLAHVVMNSSDSNRSVEFAEVVFGARLIDRTVALAFMNCNEDHHSIAFANSTNNALNHVAFLMPSGETLMKGAGRLKDAGFPIQWGPGRHGPGNNLFSYFVDPFGIPIEYTAEVQQVDSNYKFKGPDEWKWPPGRVDQWGISPPPAQDLKAAQTRVPFAAMTSDLQSSHSDS